MVILVKKKTNESSIVAQFLHKHFPRFVTFTVLHPPLIRTNCTFLFCTRQITLSSNLNEYLTSTDHSTKLRQELSNARGRVLPSPVGCYIENSSSTKYTSITLSTNPNQLLWIHWHQPKQTLNPHKISPCHPPENPAVQLHCFIQAPSVLVMLIFSCFYFVLL